MLERFSRIIGSFLVTAACYMAYAAVVVPLIEPPLPETVVEAPISADEAAALEANAEKQRADLRYWFGEHDWELDTPKIIETPQCKLLFDDYRPMENGLVELKPCSMVFLSTDGSGSEEDRKRRALVLRAPDGALLRFDSKIDLRQAKIGKLIGGELLGEVHIVGGQRLPGPEDDLMIRTRDVMLSETDISTPHLLEYRIGTHRGQGRGVAIELDNVEIAGKKELRGIKTLTLQEQVFLHLESQGNDDLFPGNTSSKTPAGVAANAAKSKTPIEIRCSGPFTFDMIQNVAVFRRAVDVSRRRPNVEADQITADQLKVFFAAKESQATAPASGFFKNSPQLTSKNLQPTRIEVVGEPAVVRAPTNNLQARAQMIEHDLATRAVRLRDADEAIVRQAENEIRTAEMQFTPDTDGRYGTFVAEGRGRILGASPDDPEQVFQAEWKKRLHFRKHEGQHVLTIEGAARVEASGRGSLSAEQIHLWLKQAAVPLEPMPQVGERLDQPTTELIADRVLALGDVKIESRGMNGNTARLEGWFEYAAVGPGMHQAFFHPQPTLVALAAVGAESLAFPPEGAESLPQAGDSTTRSQLSGADMLRRAVPLHVAVEGDSAAIGSDGGPHSSTTPRTPADFAAIPPIAGTTQFSQGDAAKQYHLQGDLMRLLIHVVEKKMHVREATVESNVRLTELPVGKLPLAQPLLITGDSLQLSQPAEGSSFVTVTGAPAYVEARGMTMSGGKLTLDRPNDQTNIVAVPGQGLMTLPIDRDLQGRQTASSEILHLTWQGQLQFDGQTAHFERGIEARTSNQLLRTDRLDVTFSEQLALGHSSQPQPDVRRIDCFDGVFLESRTVEQGTLRGLERLNARTLSLDRPTGDVVAEGPGDVTSVRVGTRRRSEADATNHPDGTAGVPAIPIGLGLSIGQSGDLTAINYLQTTFQRGMAGNEIRHEMNFYNQVRVVYGPVPDWNTVVDPDHPETWARETVLIKCDQLQVTAVKEPGSPSDEYNLVAAGNTLVEGAAYTARAPRVTYAQGKGLVVIEGDARTPAELYRQKHAGGQNSGTTAQRFMVWPETNRVQVDGATFLDLTPN